MSELEKLVDDLKEARIKLNKVSRDFIDQMDEAMMTFNAAMSRAREIERQAGIGEEK